MNGKKEAEKVGVTLRFDVQLAPPTDKETNEFSYIRLKEKEELKHSVQPSLEDDPFAQDGQDKQIEAIAKKFEEKYGPKKRKRVLHVSDLIDRGLGYDASDSFVDDAELYEDFVPHQLDTKFGGFYVNIGDLEFKQTDNLDDSDELDFITTTKKPKLKMKKPPSFQTPQSILASQKLKKAKQLVALHKNPGGCGGAIKKPLGSAGNTPPQPVKKRKQNEPKCLTPKDKMKDNTNLLRVAGTGSLTDAQSLPDGSDKPVLHQGNDILPTIRTINLSSKLGKSTFSGNPTMSGVSTGQVDPQPAVGSVLGRVQPQAVKEPPVLPNNLPPSILIKVTALEQLISKDIGADGKLSNKARISYDEHLVDIQMNSQPLSQKTRNAIFDYLAYKMSVARGTLIKRIKQELRKREDTELDKCILDLKKAIDEVMPEQIESYEKGVRVRAESMNAEKASEMVVDEESKIDDVFEDSVIGGSQALPGGGSSQDKAKRAPRKRFKWTEEIKKLLCAVVKIKVVSEERISKTSKGTGEEIINNFLEDKIKPLWPKGWMQKSVLYKTSELAHKHFTNPVPKKGQRPPNVVKTSQTTSSSVSTLSTTTTTSSTLASNTTITSTGGKLVSLGSQFINIKKELEKLSSSISSPTTSLTGGPPPTKKIAVTGIPSQMKLASTINKQLDHAHTKLGGKSKMSSNQLHPTVTVPTRVTPSVITNTSLVPPKSAAIMPGLVPKTKPGPITTSAVTYLLSTSSLNISQLLQAAGVSVSTQNKAKISQGIQLVATTKTPLTAKPSLVSKLSLASKSSAAAKSLSLTTKTTTKPSNSSIMVPSTASRPVGRDQLLTVVSAPEAMRVSPAVVQLIQKRPQKRPQSPSNTPGQPEVTFPSQLLSTTSSDHATLESVVKKVISSIDASQVSSPSSSSVISPVGPNKGGMHNSSVSSSRSDLLTKQTSSSPQVIFPGFTTTPSAQPIGVSTVPGTWTTPTEAPPTSGGVIRATPIGVPPIFVPSFRTVPTGAPPISGGCGSIQTTPKMGGLLSPSLLSSSIGKVGMIPETPPDFLPLLVPSSTNTVRPAAADRQGESPLPASPCCPKSPIEQIFKEHSYLGNSNNN